MTLGEMFDWYRAHHGADWKPRHEAAVQEVRDNLDLLNQDQDLEGWYWILNDITHQLLALQHSKPTPQEIQMRHQWPEVLLREVYGQKGTEAWAVISAVRLAAEVDTWLLWSDLYFSEAADALYEVLLGRSAPEGQAPTTQELEDWLPRADVL